MVDLLGWVLAMGIGAMAGFASGMFGIGGGVLMVPAVVFLLATPFHVAKAASLLVMSAVTVLGVREHHKARNVRLGLGLLLAAGGVLGTVAAVYLAESLSEQLLRGLFGIALAAAGVRLWFEVVPREGAAASLRLLAPPLGFAAGVLAGMLGIGGGILVVPVMALLGVPIHVAVGTSLVLVVLNAVAGTAAHASLGYWDAILGLGVPLALGAAVGVTAGARAAHRLPAARLRRAFGAFLVVVGVAMVAASL